jgi:general secretion pathway protein K
MIAPGRSRERGAALLIVMVAVAVLTALAVDLAYETRVSLRIAANARDDLRATSLAKGGVALSRLVLSFQQEIDGALPTNAPNMPSPPRPQLWRLIPVGQGLADSLFGGPGAARAAPPEGGGPPPRADGFDVDIDDEGRKVNVQLDSSSALLGAQVQALYQLVCEPRWDALFDHDDANGVRVSRQDLLVYLRDWVDEDPQVSALAASIAPGGCVMVTPPAPFEAGFGDENFPYDRGEDRYRAKNHRMDSLAELHLVAGVTDAFMAAFGDAVTVYLERDAKQTVTETDPVGLLRLATSMADPPNQAPLYDPAFALRLHQLVLERTLAGMLSISPSELGQLVELAGVTVNMSTLANTSPQNPFTDRSSTFRLRAVGRAGDVAKTLDVVVRFDKLVAGTPVTTPGRLVHWREE